MVDRRILRIILLLFKKKRKRRIYFYIRLIQLSRRFRLLSISTMTAIIAALLRRNNDRRAWILPRPQFWFNSMLNERVYEHDPYWHQQFRISRDTFNFLVQLLRGSIERRNTRLREAICVEKRVAVALWRLSTGNCFRAVASTFGIGKSSAMKVTNEVIDSLVDLHEDWIKFPQSEQETTDAIDRFSNETNTPLPQVLAAIDGCHIPIKAPQQNKESYFNRKRFYSMNLQGIVGADGRFLDVAVGFPGSIHDARVLRMSGIYGRVQRGEVLQGPNKVIHNVSVGPIIIGDSAYPGLPWLVRPYQNRNLDQSKLRFNTTLSKSRVVVEQAFGMLKGRWRCLRKELEINAKNVPKTVVACCILHNICIMRGETNTELNDDDDDNDEWGGFEFDIGNAADIREAIRSYLDGN